jgi:outer membrane protein
MQAEMTQAQKDFDEKTKTMNDQQKQEYYNQITERLSVTERDLIVPIQNKIDAAIKAVADSKGLEVVFDQRVIYYGGTDITEDVLKSFK